MSNKKTSIIFVFKVLKFPNEYIMPPDHERKIIVFISFNKNYHEYHLGLYNHFQVKANIKET